MTCESVRDMLGAYLDGELDANAEFQIRSHLADCKECTEALRRLQSLKQAIKETAIYYVAPPELESRIRSSLAPLGKNRKQQRPYFREWMAMAAAILVVVSAGLGLYLSRSRADNPELLTRQLVSGHIRAMLGTHLVDVPSSDQHTVKPWFEGKLDFSPPVKDLKQAGFVLVGGRIDYIENRPVAALVYERRKHIINLYIWPAANGSKTPNRVEMLKGFNLIQWTAGGMLFGAVSDLNPTELRQFVALLQSQS